MSDRYTSYVDLHLVLRDHQGRVLLGQRRNTGFMDGAFHLLAGHLEQGEAATAGLAREALEEGGIKLGELRLVHLMHHFTTEGRLALFFEAATWDGDVTNREPDKCAGWDWYAPEELPEMIPYAAEALDRIAKGERYSERGWERN